MHQQDSFTTCIPVVRISTTNDTRTITIVTLFGCSSTLFIESHYFTPSLRNSTLSNSLINLLSLSTSLFVSLLFETIYLLQGRSPQDLEFSVLTIKQRMKRQKPDQIDNLQWHSLVKYHTLFTFDDLTKFQYAHQMIWSFLLWYGLIAIQRLSNCLTNPCWLVVLG